MDDFAHVQFPQIMSSFKFLDFFPSHHAESLKLRSSANIFEDLLFVDLNKITLNTYRDRSIWSKSKKELFFEFLDLWTVFFRSVSKESRCNPTVFHLYPISFTWNSGFDTKLRTHTCLVYQTCMLWHTKALMHYCDAIEKEKLESSMSVGNTIELIEYSQREMNEAQCIWEFVIPTFIRNWESRNQLLLPIECRDDGLLFFSNLTRMKLYFYDFSKCFLENGEKWTIEKNYVASSSLLSTSFSSSSPSTNLNSSNDNNNINSKTMTTTMSVIREMKIKRIALIHILFLISYHWHECSQFLEIIDSSHHSPGYFKNIGTVNQEMSRLKRIGKRDENDQVKYPFLYDYHVIACVFQISQICQLLRIQSLSVNMHKIMSLIEAVKRICDDDNDIQQAMQSVEPSSRDPISMSKVKPFIDRKDLEKIIEEQKIFTEKLYSSSPSGNLNNNNNNDDKLSQLNNTIFEPINLQLIPTVRSKKEILSQIIGPYNGKLSHDNLKFMRTIDPRIIEQRRIDSIKKERIFSTSTYSKFFSLTNYILLRVKQLLLDEYYKIERLCPSAPVSMYNSEDANASRFKFSHLMLEANKFDEEERKDRNKNHHRLDPNEEEFDEHDELVKEEIDSFFSSRLDFQMLEHEFPLRTNKKAFRK